MPGLCTVIEMSFFINLGKDNCEQVYEKYNHQNYALQYGGFTLS
jgi:hypothetical protein